MYILRNLVIVVVSHFVYFGCGFCDCRKRNFYRVEGQEGKGKFRYKENLGRMENYSLNFHLIDLYPIGRQIRVFYHSLM